MNEMTGNLFIASNLPIPEGFLSPNLFLFQCFCVFPEDWELAQLGNVRVTTGKSELRR
jgi:hypothetical protein